MSTAVPASQPPAVPDCPPALQRKLVLHFDINKTLIMTDPVQGVTMIKMLNGLLSECCYGSYTDLEILSWCPVEPFEPTVTPRPGQITFGDFLEFVLKVPKVQRNDIKGAFTNEGCKGEVFRPHFDRLMEAMELPPNSPQHMPCSSVGSGYHFVLPSFYRLLDSLRERDVVLVFRSFGTELGKLAAEVNAYCSGTHPLYLGRPRLDGTDGAFDYRVHLPDASAQFYRSDSETLLAHVGADGRVAMARGFQDIWDAVHGHIARGHRAMIIQDYWPYWSKNGESDTSGKLLLVDSHNPFPEYHHIIFDDNVELDRHHIVDVRDVKTGYPIPFEFTKGRWAVKVEPLLAIQDPDYFINLLAQSEKALNVCPFCHNSCV